MEQDTFGEVIKQARKAKGISLREMASKVGISHPYLSQLENGKNNNPSIEIILDLSRELDLSFAYLIHLSGVDVGLKKSLPEKVINILKIMNPSDFEGWHSFEEFKKVFIEKGHIIAKETDDTEAVEDNEKDLLKLYNNLQKLKKIEQNAVNNAVIHLALSTDEPEDIKKEVQSQFTEWQAINNYNGNVPTAIYLNSDNEGNFYFFKEGVKIPDEVQEKLRLMIKTILD
ncbi:helix-turn-helix transcriptional regulator [Lysinibacillus sp.]|uniref:helix-turn-helix domain-containing protein n=1 Tax=Lysinibacillus sp. TaxID=1869345 RepID=UPI0028A5B18C|nr:helix-turn-helix transcriptional regulator [Lysinibacillus sp.]